MAEAVRRTEGWCACRQAIVGGWLASWRRNWRTVAAVRLQAAARRGVVADMEMAGHEMTSGNQHTYF